MKKGFIDGMLIIYVGGAILGILLVVLLCAYPLFTQADVSVTVKDKERITQGKSSRYLVWSEEGEVYENTDYLLLGKFNSSDLYGELEEGKTYECHVAGLRIPILSKYRNLIKCKVKEG